MKRKEIKKTLGEIGAVEGDFIEVERNGKTYRGILMPHHAFSGEDMLIIKLENGYNIGIRIDDNCRVKLIEKRKERRKKKRVVPFDKSRPSITLLGTGGTIASYVDYTTGAVHPASTSEELAFSVPEIFDVCNVSAKIIFQRLSEDIAPHDWEKIAREVAEELNKGAEGIIITHGTDTMGYTSAALSFLLKNLSGPVVLVGSQRSSDRPSSDAFQNLLAAAKVAVSDIGEVVIVMHGTPSPGYCPIYRGTKVRKMHSSRRDAFRSINENPIGFVDDELHLVTSYRKKSGGKTVADTSLNTNVSLVYFHPGLSEDDFRKMTEGKDGVVIAGTGLGHVSGNLIPIIEELVGKGIPVVMTTQCIWGRVNMNVYATGRKLIQAGVISGEDMLPETALVKTMWVLANFEGDDIKKMMKKNIAGEISRRTIYESYPKQKRYIP
ncbi:MAG: Glu-tRNA(Gln) amidotransferase subunit GatD [Candidatus Thermoplasmatota archaeon]|nr:Glu-tRNA(Gln) amidotransferase subunit GatD [Candidatus Thermoplasmatota archaeon]